MDKVTEKIVAKANKKWEDAQLKAAKAAEELSKAIAVVEQFRGELTPIQYADVQFKFDEQKNELEKFLLGERDKFVAKMEALGLEPLTEAASKDVE